MLFSDLGLSQSLVNAVAKEGYQSPSPIQAQAIPPILAGRDILAAAQTGTGKTAGFALPMLERLDRSAPAKSKAIRALVLTPTRELAAQVGASIARYGENTSLREAIVFGGVNIRPQISRLAKGVDLLVATPGRLLDLHSQQAVDFSALEILVLDEADRMLDMGFIHDIKRIVKLLPKKRQNLMFSATFSDSIRKLASSIVNDPIEVSVSPNNSTAKNVSQTVHPVDKSRKPALLVHLIKANDWYQVLVFSRTKHGANRLAKSLEKENISAAAIHGNKSQSARTKALADFKSGAVQALVATDIAARGLDISKLPQVVNVDLPNVPEDYVHRIGRTGRAGESGQAVSLVSADEAKQLADIERLIKKEIERVEIPGFEPDHQVPQHRGTHQPKAKPRGSRNNDANRRRQGGGGGGASRNADSRSSSGRSRRPKPGNKKPRA